MRLTGRLRVMPPGRPMYFFYPQAHSLGRLATLVGWPDAVEHFSLFSGRSAGWAAVFGVNHRRTRSCTSISTARGIDPGRSRHIPIS